MKTILIALIAMLAAGRAHAQQVNVAAAHDGNNAVTVETGAEYGFVAGAGYARVVRVVDRSVVLGGALLLNWGGFDPQDFRLSTSARVPIVGRSRWRVIGGLGTSVRTTDSDLARMTTIGADVALAAGRYSPRWFIAGELGLDVALTTRVTPSELYTMNVYGDAKSGWYRAPGAMISAGLDTGITSGSYDVIVRAGRLLDAHGQPALFPIYATLAVARRW